MISKSTIWWSYKAGTGCREDNVPILLSRFSSAHIVSTCPGLPQHVVLMAWYFARLPYLEVRLIEKEYIVRFVIYCSNGYFSIKFVLERKF